PRSQSKASIVRWFTEIDRTAESFGDSNVGLYRGASRTRTLIEGASAWLSPQRRAAVTIWSRAPWSQITPRAAAPARLYWARRPVGEARASADGKMMRGTTTLPTSTPR